MGSIVTGVMHALVERLRRARGGGRPGLAGVPIPGETGSHEATPSGAATTRWWLSPPASESCCCSRRSCAIGVNHHTPADPGRIYVGHRGLAATRLLIRKYDVTGIPLSSVCQVDQHRPLSVQRRTHAPQTPRRPCRPTVLAGGDAGRRARRLLLRRPHYSIVGPLDADHLMEGAAMSGPRRIALALLVAVTGRAGAANPGLRPDP